MKAEIAAKIVKDRSFDGQDLDELYEALHNNSEYAAEFSKLLQYLESQVLLDMKKLQDVGFAAEYLDKLDAAPAELDQETITKLNSLEFTEPREVKGKAFDAKISSKAKQQKILDSIVGAARMRTLSELRGMNSPESIDAKRFRLAKDDEERKAIYNQTLKENIDSAITIMALGNDVSEQFNSLHSQLANMENEQEREKVQKEFFNNLSADVKKKFAAVSDLGKTAGAKLRIGLADAAAYCTSVYVRSTEELKSYKDHINNRFDKIERNVQRLPNMASHGKEVWENGKEHLRNLFTRCDEHLSLGLDKMQRTGKVVFGNLWDITKKVAKGAWENKYKIAADTGAAMAYSAVLGSGLGAVATVAAGAAYGGYVLWRRVVQPARDYKKKDKKLDAKFWVKAVAGVGAAYLSFDIANSVANSKDLVGAALTQAMDNVAKERAKRVALTTAGAISANVAGVIQAAVEGDKKQTKAELVQTVFTVGLSGLTAWISSHLGGGDHAASQENANDSGGNEDAQLPETSPENGSEEIDHENTPEGTLPGEDGNALPEEGSEENAPMPEPEVEYPWDFPDQNPEDSGITDAQFENLRRIIMRHSNGDETVLNRMYHNAAANAAQFSLDPENPMTPEQLLFKFFRASAWTNHERANGWAFSETGAFGKELKALFGVLSCGDQMDSKLADRATAVLYTIRSNGSMDAKSAFALCPELEKYNDVAADGSIVGKTDAVLIGMHNDPCTEGKEVQFGHAPAPAPKVVVKEEEVVINETERENVGDTSRERMIERRDETPIQETALTRAAPVVPSAPTAPELPKIGIGTSSLEGEDAGLKGATLAEQTKSGADVGVGLDRQSKKVAERLLKSSDLEDATRQAIEQRLNEAKGR